MSRISRLAGAILAETQGQYFLIGNLKEPCDFAAAGFEPPGEIDAMQRPYVKLSACRAVTLSAPVLTLEAEGEALAKLLAERLVIPRNGSVSDRLWRVVIHNNEGAAEIGARWLGEMPAHVWQVVRESILKCS